MENIYTSADLGYYQTNLHYQNKYTNIHKIMICAHCAGEFYVQSHSPPSKVSTSFTCTGWCSDIQRWEKVILESWKQPFLRVNSQSWPAFPSKSAALRARHNMLNTKWFAQNSLKYSHSIPWDPLAPTTAHRGHWAVFIFHINLWLCQIDGLKSFFGTLILLQGKWFSISIWCMTQNICVAADFHDVPLWWHELFQHLQRFYKVSNWRFVIVSVFVFVFL